MGQYRARYGLSENNIMALNNSWNRYKLRGQGWKDFDAFALWASGSGWEPFRKLTRLDESKPYGPDNCAWQQPGAIVTHYPEGHPCRDCRRNRKCVPCEARLAYWDKHMAAIRRRYGL